MRETPTTLNDGLRDAVAAESFAILCDAITLHDQRNSAASRDLLTYARRKYLAAATDAPPNLIPLDGGR